MRSKRRTPDEQLKLIAECRQSGLTDYEWCQENSIKVSTFYAWVHRLKQSGKIDIPAVVPTVIRREPEQPDIVKIRIEGERELAPAENNSLTAEPPIESFPTLQPQQSYPVMEVVVDGIQLRVTNDVNPSLLAETIRLLRGAGC